MEKSLGRGFIFCKWKKSSSRRFLQREEEEELLGGYFRQLI